MRGLQTLQIYAAGLLLMIAGSAYGQAGCSTPPCIPSSGRSGATANRPQQPSMPSLTDPDHTPLDQQLEQDQAKIRNLERQKQLISDTQKLLALANQLKVAVDKSSKDTLSVDVIKKADEIEKLAHQVKQKMKGT